MEPKKWYTSKTLWMNALAIVAIIAQGISGTEALPVDTQAVLLGMINVILRVITKSEIKWVFVVAALPFVAGCASTAEKYFEERVDKGIVLEGGWRKTGIVISMPGDGLNAGSLTIGHEIGWGVASAMPLDEDDSHYYSHREGIEAGSGTPVATVGSETIIRVEQQGYLGPEKGEPKNQ